MKQGWEIKKLGEVCTFQRGLTYSKDDEVEHSNNCVLRSNNIDLDSMSIILNELKYINDDFAVSEDKKVKPNTILICMSNGSKQHIGKVAFIDKEYGYAFGGFMGLIKPNTEVSPKFIYYSCISSSYKHFLAGIGNGANITNLKFSDLQQYTLPVPPREEQERVVAELDCLSGMIEKKKQQLRELDALAQSIFYQMFGDPITNEKGWEVKKLGEVCISDLGKTLDAKKNKGNLYNYLCSVNVQWGYFDLTTLKEMRLEESELERYSVKQGDLLICEGGDTGRCAIWNSEEPMYYQNALHRVRFTPNTILPIFCQYIMLYMKQIGELDKYSKGQTIKHLVKSALMSIPIVMPHITLQQEFADKIEAIEKQKELIKKSISEVEDLFNSRMAYYFN